MIDDIVEMIFKEARARDRNYDHVILHNVATEVMDKVYHAYMELLWEERRKKEDENKRGDFKRRQG